MIRRLSVFAAAPLAIVLMTACNSELVTPTRPRAGRAALRSIVPAEAFFLAWTEGSVITYPIQTIAFGVLNANQYREAYSWTADQTLLSFAAANPGRLYIAGDEPDQTCNTSPSDYARIYHDFVGAVLGADSTAKFSPAGFAEPNDYCCPPPPSSCHTQMHSIGYAQQFDSAYIALYGNAPRVDEWRFHDFGNDWGDSPHSQTYDLTAWETRVNGEATWSTSHGAKMYLGSWSFMAWGNLTQDQFLAKLDSAIAWVSTNSNIVGAAWWSYENTGFNHYLENSNGTLTPEGQLYASGPLFAGISGNYAVSSGLTCRWYASASGGASPYRFNWVVAGVPWYNMPSVTYHNSGYPFGLALTAIDKYGVARTTSRTVYISPNQSCWYQ